MNHLKKIEDRVISILKTNVDARSDDMMLYLLVCNSFYSNENSVGKMPFEVVMKNYKELEKNSEEQRKNSGTLMRIYGGEVQGLTGAELRRGFVAFLWSR